MGREKEWETSVCGCLSCALPGDLAGNPDMCPDWELNQRPFRSQADTQSTEPHQPGHKNLFYMGRLNRLFRWQPFLLLFTKV